MFAILLTARADAQNSQFLFDVNGNLAVQTADFIALPQILGQPQNQTPATGESAAFSVVVADPRALTYQWRFNGANLSSQTGESLLLDNVNTNNEGPYVVVLTNPSGSVTSAPAMLWIDNDGDGMADSWEITYFGSLNQNATSDFDHDGISNLREFLDGTDPTDPNSARYRLLVVREGGAVAKSPDLPLYDKGTTVTLTLTASSNELFHAWLGDVVSRDNPVSVVMTNDKTVYARFTPISFTWTNLASDNWETATNWTPNLTPGLNDSVIINSGVTVTLSTVADCADVTLGSPATTLTGSGMLTIQGNLFWTAGLMSGSGRTILETNAILSVGGVTLDTRTLENGGTILWNGNGTFVMTGGGVITNRAGAIFRAENVTAAAIGGNLAAGRIDNAGLFRKVAGTGPLTIASALTFNNSGTVEIESDTLLCNGAFTNTGTVSLWPGATNRLAGGGASSGPFNVPATALMEWAGGPFILNPGSQLNGAGLYRINLGTLTASSDLVIANLELITGALDGTGAVTVTNAMTWTGGGMSGSGRTIIPAGVTLDVFTPTAVSLSTRTLDNAGIVTWNGVGSFSVDGGAVITNRPGALFHAQNAATLGGNGASGRFDNAGTFRKSLSTGITTVSSGVAFNNSGAVDIQTGTLDLNGGGAHGGSFTVPASTAFILSGGTHAGDVNCSIAGAGQFTVSGGSATLAGLVNVSGSNTFSGGTANLNGNYLCTNNLLTISGGTANFNGTGLVSPAVVNLSSGVLGGSSIVTVLNAMSWTGGGMSGSGRTIIPAGVTLNAAIPSAVSLATRTLENGGTVLWSGAGILIVSDGAIITNRAGALFHAQNAATLGGNGASGRFDNTGTFRKSAGTGISFVSSGVAFNNSGTVDIQTGTLDLNGGGGHDGNFTVPAGTALLLSGGTHTGGVNCSITGAGQFTVSGGTATLAGLVNVSGSNTFSGGTANLNGNYICTNNTLTISSGTANFNGTGLVSPAVVNLSSGVLGGSSVVTVLNAMSWIGGGMSGSGRTVIPAGVTLNAAIPSAVSLATRTLENGGTVLWSGAGIMILNGGAIITNRAGALFHAQNAATLGGNGASGRFDNAGTFRKSLSAGTTTVSSGVAFNNSGAVDIRNGILAADGGYVSSSNALLNCALGGTAAGTNYGQLQVSSSVTLNSALSVDLINGFLPAVYDSFTVLAAGGCNGNFSNFSFPSNQVTMQLSNTANSVIVRITSVSAAGFPPLLLPPELLGSGLKLSWTAISNAAYRVEFNPNLTTSNWSALPGDVTAAGSIASKFDTLTPSNRFYRVRVLP